MKEFLKSKFSINCELNMKKLSNAFFTLLFIFLGFSFFAHSAHASTVGPRVYVGNNGAGSVSVIDSGTNTVIATIPTGNVLSGLVLSSDGSRLYVSTDADCCSNSPGSVSVIDTTTYNVIATIPVGNVPTGMAITPDGTQIYVSNYGFGAGNGTVSVINTATNTVTINITVSPGPWNMAMSGDGTHLYVSSAPSNAIAVIDTSTNTVLSTISVPNGPAGMVLNPDGSRLYVANQSVTVINTATNSILTTIPTDNTTGFFTINSAGTRLYAAAFDKVIVLDATNNTVLTTIPMSPVPGQLGILPDDSKVYIPNDGVGNTPNNIVTIVDTTSNSTIGTVTVGENPIIVAVEKKLSVHLITVATSPVQVNTPITASANFTDPKSSHTHLASWNWGDGNTTTGTVTESNGSGSVSNSHTYTIAGVYTVTLTVTDNNGGQATSQYQYVAVYDPSAGFLTGSGKYTSQAGWDTQNPQATGEVKFGVEAKYTSGNTPTGQDKIDFKAGNLLFSSTSFQWLVINGAKATLKGNGTVNGSGNYTFLIAAIDGSHTGGQSLIRVKITDSSNTVMYDTQQGASDTTDPTTAVTNGQIKVH